MFSHLILDSDLDGNLCAITLDAAEDSAKGTNTEAILFMEVIRRLSRDPKPARLPDPNRKKQTKLLKTKDIPQNRIGT